MTVDLEMMIRSDMSFEQTIRKVFREGILQPAALYFKNIDLLQKMALGEILELKGDELVLDFGCGSGRFSYWIASRCKIN
jgi:cyclopropane fatty-acyl-phospholipid synthase-like methyltransferase